MSLRPLRDLDDDADPGASTARALARAFPPLVRGAIPPARGAQRRSSHGWLLRPAFFVLFLLVAAAASAMIRGVLRARRASPSDAPRSKAPPRSQVSAPEAKPKSTAPLAVPAEPTPPSTQGAAKPLVAKPTAVVKRVELPSLAASEPTRGEDFSILVSAMKALRTEHDPHRAGVLVGGYLAQHPDGALAEEALAIAFEAALAAGDDNASSLASQYVERFPDGRYVASARSVMAHRTP